MRVQGAISDQLLNHVGTIESDSSVIQQNHNPQGNIENSTNGQSNKVVEEEVIKAIEKANEEFKWYDRRFEFSIHEQTKEIMVKIIDTTSDQVIREIPPKKILDMVAKMMEIAGIIVDEKA